jgi:hypothetical protein
VFSSSQDATVALHKPGDSSALPSIITEDESFWIRGLLLRALLRLRQSPRQAAGNRTGRNPQRRDLSKICQGSWWQQMVSNQALELPCAPEQTRAGCSWLIEWNYSICTDKENNARVHAPNSTQHVQTLNMCGSLGMPEALQPAKYSARMLFAPFMH